MFRLSELQMKGSTMKNNLPESNKDTPRLSLVQEPEEASAEMEPVNLENERKILEEQEESEDYWAGRNLARRNSARKAA
jgi:hypothetical protein